MATETLPCSKIPTVELGELGAQHTREPSQQEWERVSSQLEQALSENGYAYLTQHGMPDDVVNSALSAGADFFQLGEEEKRSWSTGEGFTGYLKNDEENYTSGSHDQKETFLFRPGDYSSLKKEPPPFKTALTPFYNLIQTLNTRLMTSLSLTLGKPRDYFAKMHAEGTDVVYRFNYYPGCTSGEGVVGMGAHIDYTTFTLLFSNGGGGFQVRDPSGQWVDLPNVPGTVLLMGGEFLTFYSNKRFKAPEHRVLLPSDEQQGRSSRLSLIFFLHADGHTPMWPPSDDPATPPPPSVKEYLEKLTGKARAAGYKY